MPPISYRKRQRSVSPEPPPPAKKRKAAATTVTPKKAKPTLFDTADALSRTPGDLDKSRKLLEDLDGDQDSSLSEADSDEFEDVPPAKRQKTGGGKSTAEEDDDDDGEMDWEDAIQPGSSSHPTPSAARDEDAIGDVSISMNEDGSYIEPLVSAATGKKGPSKRERQIRVHTHCLHVMSLMWHNTVRNSWINDKEVQKILVEGLPDGVNREVQRWGKNLNAMGKGKAPVKEVPKPVKETVKRGKKGGKNSGRDWNKAAESREPDAVQVTSALLRLLKVLAGYWRKRFTVTAPGLRKQGYKDLRRLRNHIKDWEKDRSNAADHGERIEDVRDFRKHAKSCDGSRDVGGQLFVALLRGLGLEVRLVANLQPAGFGWSKAEEADPPKAKKKTDKAAELSESESEVEVKVTSMNKMEEVDNSNKSKAALKKETPTRKSSRGNQGDPIDLDDSESSLSDAPSEPGKPEESAELDADEDDDLSVIDVTPSIPKKKPHKKYDRDLAFPIYWAEVCDPVSHRYFPVDPVVLSTIASSDELLQTFEPRGKKAELSKQVMCYIMAYSADGTAKDVTIRYLKRHQLPGKTKGVRIPVERVPIYNRKGKVRRYEDYDWFRTLSSLYDRPEVKRTAADDVEEQTDLKPYKPAKEDKVVEKESLQGYKQSADYVLEQHLRREEALAAGAKPVKTFTAGKGDKAVEHPVYLRSDVLVCRTVESWHKEGRAINVGEQPLKYVPMRAVTLIRKREIEDAQRETGEKLKQGLYSQAQTDWIIPPPIENGVIPRNAFGNMDVYVPTMVPKGAVHLQLRGTAKICRKLQIDFAEACTGFEFGKQRAVPVLTGVVVAKENERLVRDAWKVEREEQKRKEDVKRTAAALHWWRKMLLGLRVLERMRTEYADSGGTEEEINPFVLKARREGREGEAALAATDAGEDMGGGFMRSDDEEDRVPQKAKQFAEEVASDGGGGFLVEEEAEADGGGFLVEDEPAGAEPNAKSKNYAPITPVSLHAMHTTVDNVDDSEIEEEEPTKKRTTKSAKTSKQTTQRSTSSKKRGKQPSANTTTNNRRRQKVVISEEESSLSDLSDDAASEDDDDTNDDDIDSSRAPPKNGATKRRSSPQVLVSPQKRSTPANSGRKSARAANKATPTRSPYFDHDAEDDESSGESESDHEVVKPRQTTARTRSKR